MNQLKQKRLESLDFKYRTACTDFRGAVVWMHLTTRCQALWQQVRVAMVTAPQLKAVRRCKLFP